MAEIIGVVSGVLTLAGVAGKAGASVLTLKRLWNEVKDVPDSINFLMMQLEHLDPVFQDMENEFSQVRAAIQNDSRTNLSQQYARQAVQDLEGLVNDLQQQLSSKKGMKGNIAKFKVTLKKDLVRSYQERLQHALQLVSLSQQTHLMTLSRLQTSLIVSEFQALHSKLPTEEKCTSNIQPIDDVPEAFSLTQDERPATQNDWLSVQMLPWSSSNWFCNFTYYATEVPISKYNTNKVYQSRIQLPRWLVQKAWDIQAYKANSGWKWFLRPWTTRPQDSKVFEHALYGSTSELRRLLDSDEASIYDRDDRGMTLLHYAVFSGHSNTIKILVERGLGIEEVDNAGLGPLGSNIGVRSSDEELLETYRFLSSRGALDDIDDDLFLADNRSLLRKTGLYYNIWQVPGILEFIVANFCPGFYEFPYSAKFGFLDWIFVDAHILLRVIKNSSIVSPQAFREQLREGKNNSLHSFAEKYFYESSFCTRGASDIPNRNNVFEHWRTLARWIFTDIPLAEISSMHVGYHKDMTPLFSGLYGRWLVDPGSKNKFIQAQKSRCVTMWLEDLLSSGVNLMEYGEQEWTIFMKSDSLCELRWSTFYYDFHPFTGKRIEQRGPKLLYFTYGPHPSDWVFTWDPAVEGFVGEFWEMIESRPTPIPGEWIDD